MEHDHRPENTSRSIASGSSNNSILEKKGTRRTRRSRNSSSSNSDKLKQGPSTATPNCVPSVEPLPSTSKGIPKLSAEWKRRTKFKSSSEILSLCTLFDKVLNEKTIWKPPVCSVEHCVMDTVLENLTPTIFTYVIKPVTQSKGFLVRKRSSCCFINLNTFGNHTIFISRFRLRIPDDLIQILVEKTEKLTVNTDMFVNKKASVDVKIEKKSRRKKKSVLTPVTMIHPDVEKVNSNDDEFQLELSNDFQVSPNDSEKLIVHSDLCVDKLFSNDKAVEKRKRNRKRNFILTPNGSTDRPSAKQNKPKIWYNRRKSKKREANPSVNLNGNEINEFVESDLILSENTGMLTNNSEMSSEKIESLDKYENKPKRERKGKKNTALKTPIAETSESLSATKTKSQKRWYRKKNSKNKECESFIDHLNENKVAEGLADGTLVKGFIRINQRNHKDAYVTSIIKGDSDYFVKSVIDQNRALDGDEVILKVKPKTEWEDGRKTATVVYISKMVHSRTTVGKLIPLPKNENFAAFFPRDKRVPIIHIPTISWPNGFKSDPAKFADCILVAKITEWTNPECAKGLIIENIGNSGNLKNENLAILKTFGLDHEPFTNDLLTGLPRLDSLHDEWMEGRRDLRKECIFTIDPLTARDLDDAMSCKVLPDGNLEIGVHIADVSFFLKEGNDLDRHVAWRATSTYMVDQVHHMLPVELCMSCSLLPGKDKLSFSVFWVMTPDGEIISTSFAKTVMNSCVQLAYEHAQAIIDDPDHFDPNDLPKILNGYTVDHIKDVVLKLYHISKNLRKKRFENGALRIDQIKLTFELNPSTGLPLNYHQHVQKEANHLIEEFMLLANISVAEKLIETFPDIAFLRLHEPPKESMMVELKSKLESVGIHVDISSASCIQNSLWKYCSDDLPGQIRLAVLNHLLAKPMTRARYFCPGLKTDDSFRHYALNIPLYTHFTSPIRRYADVMVHRLLAASLGIVEKPYWDPLYVTEVAERCNWLKYNAKKAQEESTKLYYCILIAKNGPFIRDAAVVDVRERTFDVLVLDSGEIVRIYLNDIDDITYALEEIPCVDLNSGNKENQIQRRNWRMNLVFTGKKNQPSLEITIELFTLVKVELKKCNKRQKLIAKLLRPTMT